MNKTEQKAERWLRVQGQVPIFQPRKSPDFVCQDGAGYEVKLLRENSITFSARQFGNLNQFPGELTILVFDDDDNPLYVIPFNEIAERPLYWKHIRLAIYDYPEPRAIRDIDQELYNEARAEAVRQGKTIGQWLNEAIKSKLKKGVK